MQLYDEGDEEMKRTIGKAWFEANGKRGGGAGAGAGAGFGAGI